MYTYTESTIDLIFVNSRNKNNLFLIPTKLNKCKAYLYMRLRGKNDFDNHITSTVH